MKKLVIFIALVSGLFMQAQSEEDMKAWQVYMTPSETHQLLAKDTGSWSGDVQMWMAPNSEPSVSMGKMDVKMILGGRYQESTFSGEFEGMPFEGVSLISYDNALDEFTSVWVDNFGTGMMVLKGKWVEFGKSIELKGKMVDPMTGKEMDVKEVYLYEDENHQRMEMFMMLDGQEFKTMEINYIRQ